MPISRRQANGFRLTYLTFVSAFGTFVSSLIILDEHNPDDDLNWVWALLLALGRPSVEYFYPGGEMVSNMLGEHDHSHEDDDAEHEAMRDEKAKSPAKQQISNRPMTVAVANGLGQSNSNAAEDKKLNGVNVSSSRSSRQLLSYQQQASVVQPQILPRPRWYPYARYTLWLSSIAYSYFDFLLTTVSVKLAVNAAGYGWDGLSPLAASLINTGINLGFFAAVTFNEITEELDRRCQHTPATEVSNFQSSLASCFDKVGCGNRNHVIEVLRCWFAEIGSRAHTLQQIIAIPLGIPPITTLWIQAMDPTSDVAIGKRLGMIAATAVVCAPTYLVDLNVTRFFEGHIIDRLLNRLRLGRKARRLPFETRAVFKLFCCGNFQKKSAQLQFIKSQHWLVSVVHAFNESFFFWFVDYDLVKAKMSEPVFRVLQIGSFVLLAGLEFVSTTYGEKYHADDEMDKLIKIELAKEAKEVKESEADDQDDSAASSGCCCVTLFYRPNTSLLNGSKNGYNTLTSEADDKYNPLDSSNTC